MTRARFATPQVLIPNATSPRNVGDLAMLTELVKLIKESFPRVCLTIHSSEPELHARFGTRVKNTLYSYVAFDNRSSLTRIIRVIRLSLYFVLFRCKCTGVLSPILRRDCLFQLCLDYANADVIVFVGGGYIRSKHGLTQTLNLLMHLLMIAFAKMFRSRTIIAPISFGPFAHMWQERLAARVVNGCNAVASREGISHSIMKRYNVKHLIRSVDHALLLRLPKHKPIVSPRRVIGLTLRQWFRHEQQQRFEESVITAVSQFAKEHSYSVQPIIQVDAQEYGDNDRDVTRRVCSSIRRAGVNVYPTRKVTNLTTAREIYSSIRILLGMRMHSNILAAVTHTPFVAIAYEHKTRGISQYLGMTRFCLDAQSLLSPHLSALLTKQHKEVGRLTTMLKEKISRFREAEEQRWVKLLSSAYAYS